MGSVTPSAAINPLTVADAGGLVMLNQTGEFLIFDSNLKLALEPMLALSWGHNGDGSVWTFKLRPGVKFSTGAPMTADDVVYTFKQLSDSKNTASNALSTFTDVLTPDGVKKMDSTTVQFTLEAPNGNFPYLVSSDNYNAIIVPNGTDFGKWQKTFVGTGAFKLQAYTQNVGASFVPNPNYWGKKPLLAGTSFKFYASQQPLILALQGSSIDVITQFVPAGATAILHNASYKIIQLKSASHRELSMRNDQPPFDNAQVRQAVAYSLDRKGMVNALLSGYGLGRERHPVRTPVPVIRSVASPARAEHLKGQGAAQFCRSPKRHQRAAVHGDLPGDPPARAGHQGRRREGGDQLRPQDREPDAVLRQGRTATPTGSTVRRVSSTTATVASRMCISKSPLTSNGPWNAAHFKNSEYDALVKKYVAALDLPTQKQIATQIETLLLKETPIVIPYWIDGLTASTPSVGGLNPTSIAQLFLNQAFKSA